MKNNRTAYVILGMLSIGQNLSGYEIHKAIEDNFGSFWGESNGQIYPTLTRLATERLIEPSKTVPGPGRRRQEYALTDAGRASLREWLALPFQNDPPRNEFLLKLFFGLEAAPGVSAGHIRELQERNRSMLNTLLEIDTYVRAHPSHNPHEPYWMLTLSLGIAMARAALDWGESALTQLSTVGATGAESPLTTNRSSIAGEA